jgi:hypothetical protein
MSPFRLFHAVRQPAFSPRKAVDPSMVGPACATRKAARTAPLLKPGVAETPPGSDRTGYIHLCRLCTALCSGIGIPVGVRPFPPWPPWRDRLASARLIGTCWRSRLRSCSGPLVVTERIPLTSMPDPGGAWVDGAPGVPSAGARFPSRSRTSALHCDLSELRSRERPGPQVLRRMRGGARSRVSFLWCSQSSHREVLR